MAASYYAADGLLAVQQVTRDTASWNGSSYVSPQSWGVYEEYWYDALGRRVLKRSRQDTPLCTMPSRCSSTITRFVWDGANILWELQQPGSGDLDVQNPTGYGLGGETGNIGYVHAGGIDSPLGMVRNGTGLVLFRDKRGLYTDVTDAAGNHNFFVTLPGDSWTAQGYDFDVKNTQTWAARPESPRTHRPTG